MSAKKPNTITEITPQTVPKLNQNIDLLYSHKAESRHKNVNGTHSEMIFQSFQHGEVIFSANGSPSTVLSFGFKERQQTIIFAIAHAKSNAVTAHVTDVTNTGITIEVFPRVNIDITAVVNTTTATSTLLKFSQATTANVTIYYQVVGSSP